MTKTERDAFLEPGGTGVMSFGTVLDEPPVSMPVSYGYHSENRTLFFNLTVSPGCRKANLLDRDVSFVTYRETDRGWRSVVATGRLIDVDDLPPESSTVQALWDVHIPTTDIFAQPRAERSFRDVCLDPETLAGRKEIPAQC